MRLLSEHDSLQIPQLCCVKKRKLGGFDAIVISCKCMSGFVPE